MFLTHSLSRTRHTKTLDPTSLKCGKVLIWKETSVHDFLIYLDLYKSYIYTLVSLLHINNANTTQQN